MHVINEVIKIWCVKCNKTSECFIIDLNNNYENNRCVNCTRQCPPFATVLLKVICPNCTRKILRERGLEPVGGTQAGNTRWYSMECKECNKIITEPCAHLKKFTKL